MCRYTIAVPSLLHSTFSCDAFDVPGTTNNLRNLVQVVSQLPQHAALSPACPSQPIPCLVSALVSCSIRCPVGSRRLLRQLTSFVLNALSRPIGYPHGGAASRFPLLLVHHDEAQGTRREASTHRAGL